MVISLRPQNECRWDCISLGEIMIRFDPFDGRTRTARLFRVWEGGGEYNVVRGLRRCFGMRTSVITAIVDNEIGRLLEDLILQGGVDTSHIIWKPFDGLGRKSRNGLNFTERGFGVRAAKGCADRGNTATSQLKTGDIDFAKIFKDEGTRWFHCGGIFTGLSESTSEVAQEAMKAARKYGAIVSYDLNYRASLWKDFGGKEKAQEINRELAQFVDIMIGNEEDFSACLGYKIEGCDLNKSTETLDTLAFRKMIEKVVKDYPGLKAVATTLRNAKTANINDWGAICWHDGKFYEAIQRPNLEIFDRVGGGDSFASGLIYGFLMGMDAGKSVEYGAAHGALAMTTPGDTTMATLSEVEKLIMGGSARVDR